MNSLYDSKDRKFTIECGKCGNTTNFTGTQFGIRCTNCRSFVYHPLLKELLK